MASDEKESPKSGVGGPKSEDSKTVTSGEKAPSPKVEGREGPTTNPRVTHFPVSVIGSAG